MLEYLPSAFNVPVLIPGPGLCVIPLYPHSNCTRWMQSLNIQMKTKDIGATEAQKQPEHFSSSPGWEAEGGRKV